MDSQGWRRHQADCELEKAGASDICCAPRGDSRNPGNALSQGLAIGGHRPVARSIVSDQGGR